tara:strand:+ start:760 stop:1311 length:552 start_codon:yes stop_codon:yes gene_type:complete
MKTCTKCKEDKPLISFNKRSETVWRKECKVCLNSYASSYRKDKKIAIAKQRKEHYEDNKDSLLVKQRDYYQENSTKCNERSREYHRNNKDTIAETKRIYLDNNRGKHNEACARRRAAKLNASPNWVTEEEREAIRELYKEARKKGMHVDHEIPLQGKTVCGLHVLANLQLLSPTDNLSKSNKF